MATRKKKTEVIVSAEVAETLEPKVSKKAKEAKKVIEKVKEEITWPKVTKGNHLTVTTHENGKTELVWDDEALAKEVRDAIASVESKPKKVKKTKAT